MSRADTPWPHELQPFTISHCGGLRAERELAVSVDALLPVDWAGVEWSGVEPSRATGLTESEHSNLATVSCSSSGSISRTDCQTGGGFKIWTKRNLATGELKLREDSMAFSGDPATGLPEMGVVQATAVVVWNGEGKGRGRKRTKFVGCGSEERSVK